MTAEGDVYLLFTSENLISAFQKEPILWNLDMQWDRGRQSSWPGDDIFNMKTTCIYN